MKFLGQALLNTIFNNNNNDNNKQVVLKSTYQKSSEFSLVFLDMSVQILKHHFITEAFTTIFIKGQPFPINCCIPLLYFFLHSTYHHLTLHIYLLIVYFLQENVNSVRADLNLFINLPYITWAEYLFTELIHVI